MSAFDKWYSAYREKVIRRSKTAKTDASLSTWFRNSMKTAYEAGHEQGLRDQIKDSANTRPYKAGDE